MAVAAVILAAGASRRLGRPKQLVMYQGETLLGRAIRIADEAGAAPVVVVLGAQAQMVRDAVHPESAHMVVNPEWNEGMASSIRAGVRYLEGCAPQASGVLLMGCDQPLLSAAHVRLLIETFENGQEERMVASVYAGVRAVPAVFPRAQFANLCALRGDKGARSLLVHASCPLVEAPWEGGAVDIDEPGDLEKLAER